MSAGYYTFELYVSSPTSGVTLTWKLPGQVTSQALSAFYISTQVVGQVASYAQNMSLSMGFQVSAMTGFSHGLCSSTGTDPD